MDVVVLGSGAAGLAVALAARPNRSVLVVTKETSASGSTTWAQGGLAAVLDRCDSVEQHIADTMTAGAGLCDPEAVRDLAGGAPAAIRSLERLGASFDVALDGSPALTLEGGHSHARVVHAGGDRSGLEIHRTLEGAVRAAGVEVLEHAFALDLVWGRTPDGWRQIGGVRVARLGRDGEPLSVGLIHARAVVIATGGFGQVFAATSNPSVATGDGVAMALRAGIAVRDVEFVQFHPTVLWTQHGPPYALVSEAVRGEGAVLRDALGEPVMADVHPLADLAPRDVVAAAVADRMAQSRGGVRDHVLLDATPIGPRFYERFPTITAACRAAGIDPARDPIPVAPAAHYSCGGIPATLAGGTPTWGLFAVGEASCTGVHGANRLASNSLTEGFYAGTRLGETLRRRLPAKARLDASARRASDDLLPDPKRRVEIQSTMSANVGVLRSAEGLAQSQRQLADIPLQTPSQLASRSAWETANLLTIAQAVILAATTRLESRGCHRRSDHPHPVSEWQRHIDVSMTSTGALSATTTPPPDER